MIDKTLEETTFENLHKELFEIYKNSQDDSVKVNALFNLIAYKKDLEFKKHNEKSFENMLKAMKNFY